MKISKPVIFIVTLREAIATGLLVFVIGYFLGALTRYIHDNDLRAMCASKHGGVWIESTKECLK